MTESLFEQVIKNAQWVAACPLCSDTPTPGLIDTCQNQQGPGSNGVHKRGRYKGLYRNSMPVCWLCKGLKVVYLNRVCECGSAAVIHNSEKKVWTCGSIPCVERASWRSNPVSTAAVWDGL